MFADYWQRQTVDEDFIRLGRMLGVHWTKEDAAQLQDTGKHSNKAPESVNIPLLLGMQPHIHDAIKKIFMGMRTQENAPKWLESAEEIEDLYGSTNKEDFLKVVNNFLAPTLIRTGANLQDRPTPTGRSAQRHATPVPKTMPSRKRP